MEEFLPKHTLVGWCAWCERTPKDTAACDSPCHYTGEVSVSKSGWKIQKMGLFWDLLSVWTVLEERQPFPFTPVCAGGLPHEGLIPSLDSLCSGKFSVSAAGAGLELSWLQPNLVFRNEIKNSSGQCHCA